MPLFYVKLYLRTDKPREVETRGRNRLRIRYFTALIVISRANGNCLLFDTGYRVIGDLVVTR